jgi:hypothetical protein
MERDAAAQREALNKILADANARMEAFVDKTILMSNVATMSAYVTAGSVESKVRDGHIVVWVGDPCLMPLAAQFPWLKCSVCAKR